MSGKPKKLPPEHLARAQALVDAGYRLKDVAARFGVASSQLNRYGIRVRPTPAEEKKEPVRQRRGRGGIPS
jgi:transposase-like protein